MKIVAIIQARMSSTRLPNKVLLPLGNVPVIERMVDRARRISGLADVMVATSDSLADDKLARFCHERGIAVSRGSETDVLDRFYHASRPLGVDAVMRLTGDCPFLDPIESHRVLEAFITRPSCDYACNIEPPFLPDGLDTEVIRFSTLERIWREVAEPLYREHVTYYVRSHREAFNSVSLSAPYDLSSCRWTLDEPKDYEMLSAITDELCRRNQFGYLREIVTILEERPDIARINSDLERDASLKAALARMSRVSA